MASNKEGSSKVSVIHAQKGGVIRGDKKSRNKLYYNDKLLDLIAQ